MAMQLMDLPPDLLLEVMSHMEVHDAAMLGVTCKDARAIYMDVIKMCKQGTRKITCQEETFYALVGHRCKSWPFQNKALRLCSCGNQAFGNMTPNLAHGVNGASGTLYVSKTIPSDVEEMLARCVPVQLRILHTERPLEEWVFRVDFTRYLRPCKPVVGPMTARMIAVGLIMTWREAVQEAQKKPKLRCRSHLPVLPSLTRLMRAVGRAMIRDPSVFTLRTTNADGSEVTTMGWHAS